MLFHARCHGAMSVVTNQTTVGMSQIHDLVLEGRDLHKTSVGTARQPKPVVQHVAKRTSKYELSNLQGRMGRNNWTQHSHGVTKLITALLTDRLPSGCPQLFNMLGHVFHGSAPLFPVLPAECVH